ncbi:MAG: hypothetical protein ABIH69_05805 [bacterium]|nr:hypothetical protein [Candidatus Margulisiibacteriota bacterium]
MIWKLADRLSKKRIVRFWKIGNRFHSVLELLKLYRIDRKRALRVVEGLFKWRGDANSRLGASLLSRFFGIEKEGALYLYEEIGHKNGAHQLTEVLRATLLEGKLKRAAAIVEAVALDDLSLAAKLLVEGPPDMVTPIISHVFRSKPELAGDLALELYKESPEKAIEMIGEKSSVSNVDKAQRGLIEHFLKEFPISKIFKNILPELAAKNLTLAEEIARRLSLDENYQLYVMRKECGELYLTFQELKSSPDYMAV